MTQANAVEPAWLASVLAPWTVSPHPNFSQKAVLPPAMLALVTERRFFNERDRYGEDAVLYERPWEADLVKAASQSLDAPTQQLASASLWTMATSSQLPAGARVAAAMFASVGSAELEMSSDAARRLGGLAIELADRREPAACPPSLRLVIAALFQHRVARLYDSCEASEALAAATEVLRWIPRTSERGHETFAVSQGISWSATRVQDDMARSLKQHALEAKSSLEGLRGQSWIRVVRARKTWIDMRLNNMAAERDSSVLRDAYELKIESLSGTRHFMRRSTAEAGYEALQLRELAGQIGQAKAARESLGKILLIEPGVNEHRTREAIRLLRQAGAQAPLKTALAWVRNQGPVGALRSDAMAVISRVELDGWITEADLLVLGAAGDFLTQEDRARALRVCISGLAVRPGGVRSSWSIHDRVWKTVAALIPGSGESSFAANQISAYLEGNFWRSRPISDTLARVVEAIDWADVGAEDRERISTWMRDNLPTNDDFDELWRSVSAALDGGSRGLPEGLSLARAAFLADNGRPKEMSPAELQATSEYVGASLKAEVAQARKGSYSFGGYSTANVAVAFAMRFGDEALWTAILEHLTDSKVDAVLKAEALDRIARFSSDVPSWFARAFGESAELLLRSARSDHLFGSRSLPVFAEAVRALGALRQLSAEVMIDAVMRLASGDADARVEAAKTIAYALGDEDAAWGHALLLQLSYDANPVVRAEAAGGLMVTSLRDSRLTKLVRERISALFEEEGVRTTAMLLTAIRRLINDGVNTKTLGYLRSQVKRLAGADSPRLVQDIAAETLASMTDLSSPI